jgi:hypothetical protein
MNIRHTASSPKKAVLDRSSIASQLDHRGAPRVCQSGARVSAAHVHVVWNVNRRRRRRHSTHNGLLEQHVHVVHCTSKLHVWGSTLRRRRRHNVPLLRWLLLRLLDLELHAKIQCPICQRASAFRGTVFYPRDETVFACGAERASGQVGEWASGRVGGVAGCCSGHTFVSFESLTSGGSFSLPDCFIFIDGMVSSPPSSSPNCIDHSASA